MTALGITMHLGPPAVTTAAAAGTGTDRSQWASASGCQAYAQLCQRMSTPLPADACTNAGSGKAAGLAASSSTSSGGSGASKVALGGGVGGSLAALAVLVSGFIFWRRRRNRHLGQTRGGKGLGNSSGSSGLPGDCESALAGKSSQNGTGTRGPQRSSVGSAGSDNPQFSLIRHTASGRQYGSDNVFGPIGAAGGSYGRSDPAACLSGMSEMVSSMAPHK